MRYRRVKAAKEKFSLYNEYIIENAIENVGKWKEIFGNENPIFLEMGCGKGKFIIEQALRNPNCNFIGVEGQAKVLLKGAQLAFDNKLANVRFISEFLRQPGENFNENEISGLFLNFSDPWPKERHAKRRLTHGRFLSEYRKFLKAGARVEFKTDNDGLFDFSIEEFPGYGYRILEISYDLHQSGLSAIKVTTEYEEKFKLWGKKIKYLKAVIE